MGGEEMTSKKCPSCDGTGKEPCEVHGSHRCKRCNGSGCINKEDSFNTRFFKWTKHPMNVRQVYE